MEANGRDTILVKKEDPENEDSIVKGLPGEWKEVEYPFRRAHFKRSEVKFIEEGIVEEPAYQEYKISATCPFDVNNIKTASAGDLFLVMSSSRTCEIIKVAGDSLTLTGFNASSNSNYSIVYKRVGRNE